MKEFRGRKSPKGSPKKGILKPALIINKEIDSLAHKILKEAFALPWQASELKAVGKIKENIQKIEDKVQQLSDRMMTTRNMEVVLAEVQRLKVELATAERELQDFLDKKLDRIKTPLIGLKDALFDAINRETFLVQNWDQAFRLFQAFYQEQLKRNGPNTPRAVKNILMIVEGIFKDMKEHQDARRSIKGQANDKQKEQQMTIEIIVDLNHRFYLIFDEFKFLEPEISLVEMTEVNRKLMEVEEYAITEKERAQMKAARAKENQRLKMEEERRLELEKAIQPRKPAQAEQLKGAEQHMVKEEGPKATLEKGRPSGLHQQAPLLPSQALRKSVSASKPGEDFVKVFHIILKKMEDNKSNIASALSSTKLSKFNILLAMLKEIDFETDKQFAEAIRELKDIETLIQTLPMFSKNISGASVLENHGQFKQNLKSDVETLERLQKQLPFSVTSSPGFRKHPE